MNNTTHNTEAQRKITILRGHTTPETAYLVDDYPYGFTLRCKIRYWLEYKKGHGHRLVSQTTNPKVPGEVWNKPKGSTYLNGLAVIYLDDKGHLVWSGVSLFSRVEQFDEFRAKFDLDEGELKSLDVLEKISRKYNPTCWAEYDA